MSYITGLAGTPDPGISLTTTGSRNCGWPPRPGASPSTPASGPVRRLRLTTRRNYDNFLSARAAQGFTVVMTDPVWAAHGASYAYNGNTWDGVTPLAGGSTDPSSAA